MITAASAAAAVLLATAPYGQTAPSTAGQTPPTDVTSSLNSGPPRPATYLAPEPAPVTAAPVAAAIPSPTPAPARPTTATPAPGPAPTRPAATPAPGPAPAAAPAPARPVATAPAPSPAPVRTTPAPAPARPTPAPAAAPVAAPAASPAPVEAPPPPPTVPTVTVLDSAARAALPFTVDLPSGFEIVTGRPGPDFRIYTIRRGGRSFAMVYVGPASQFPIYTGEMVEAAGRASVVSTEDGVRHAREHLFQRPEATPREVHIWTMSLDGADRALAEQIAQSLDVR